MKKILFIFLSILLSSDFFAVESNIHFSQISTKDGLSQNTVRTILEDSTGFIWAGTLDGLNRYDGYRLVPYKPQLGNPNSLIDHRIKEIFQDKDGYLWIKTFMNEFICHDPIANSFPDYYHSNENEKRPTFLNYYEATNGDIWLWGESDRCLRIYKDRKNIQATPFLMEKGAKCRKSFLFLFEDSRSNIWIGGKLGLFKVNGNQIDEFYEGKYSFTKAVELNNKIYFTTEDSSVVEYDIKRKQFQEITNLNKKDIFLNAAKLNNDELLIVGSHSGILLFNVNSHVLKKPHWAEDRLLKGDIQLIVDENAGIWIYNHTGIVWYYNQESKTIRKMELIPTDIAKIIDSERYNVYIDSDNLIWITTYGNGLFSYDTQRDVLTNYKHDASRNSPASDYLLAITEDRYGNIWIGSEYAGIIKMTKSNYDTQIIRPEKDVSIGKNNNIRAIYSDKYSNIWVGTKNGSLYVYDNALSTGKCIYEDISPYTLHEDSKNRIWIGTKGNGIYIVDQNSFKEVAHLLYDPSNHKSLIHNSIYSIIKDTKGRMWIGSFGRGMNLAEETDGGIEFRRFFSDQDSYRFIRCIYQDTKGMIWVGGNDGIIRFDPDEFIKDPSNYVTYRMNLNNKNGLNCNDVKTIYEDEDGIIWIGTAGGGLNKYIEGLSHESDHFKAYTIENGLPSDFVSGIMEDKERNLWISTESGIVKFDKNSESFVTYQFSENTYCNHFNENANIYCSNGRMLWGSLNGLLSIKPESFISDMDAPPVTLTNFFVYDQMMQAGEKDTPLKQSISYTKEIKLNYEQNTFTIEFASLNLKDPTKNKYIYVLENYDEQWSPVGYTNTATYKNLPAGNYTFKVKGTNSDGVWNERATVLKIIITPPWWKSSVAYIFYFLFLLLLLYIAIRIILKFNTLNNNIKIEKELTNHKLRFFTNVSHEFRTPLTLIRGAIEKLNNLNELPATVEKQMHVLNRNSDILTRLIDQLLEFRKIQNNVLTLNLENTDIVSFSEEIFSGFNELASQKEIEYVFLSEIPSLSIYIDRSKVDKILYNLLSNAFKFTPRGGRIELLIQECEETKTCRISIKDNGIGVEKEKQELLFSRFMQINFSSSGTGIGLSVVKEFIEVHKGKVWYESNAEQGSIFCFELSTTKDIYQEANFVSSTLTDMSDRKGKEQIISSNAMYDQILPEPGDHLAERRHKMLIIDDNEDICNFLVDEFGKYFIVETADNGKSGLEKAKENNPDLIICDVMMPEMDGFEVTRQLKDDFQTCHIPVILLTAHSSIEHQQEGIQSGADAYIMKPFSLNYLLIRVFKLIEQREQLKKRFSNEYVLDGNLINLTDKDKDFFNKIERIMDMYMSDIEFSVERFAELANMRRTLFYKKVKGITGLSPNEYVKIKRLKRAAELILEGNLTISEITYKVGFESPQYFSRCFKEQYNCSPSKYGQPVETKK